MQKKLIALAVAGLASTAAFAQSNVTIYGVADATFDVVKTSSAAGNADLGSMTRVSTNSSYIGFKGLEDLGNGLKAVFQFESSVAFDTGAGLNTARDSYAGIAGGFGTVAAGRLTGPTRALGASLDVFAGSTGIGANSGIIGKLGNMVPVISAPAARGATIENSVFDTRFSNTIAYISPNLSGFTLTGAYVSGENKTLDNAVVKANLKGYDVGAVYNNGPIMAGLTYNHVALGDLNDTKAKDLRLGGSYNFGVASLRVMYDRVKADDNVGTDIKQNVWGIGGTYNVTTNGKLVAQYYKAGDVKVAGATANETGAKLFAVGYEHSLSKRTLLKATYSRLANNDFANYGFGVSPIGGTAAGATNSGVQVGLRHSF
ncbi:porin [Azospira sp. I13]|uniref:porin n=1 Tax=Azospira sp. I13 TaxID=1765050 RepID=UPI000D4DC642|nr:porin [Azospira sp. I13]GBG02521.1 porin [Azospira sp. I13]